MRENVSINNNDPQLITNIVTDYIQNFLLKAWFKTLWAIHRMTSVCMHGNVWTWLGSVGTGCGKRREFYCHKAAYPETNDLYNDTRHKALDLRIWLGNIYGINQEICIYIITEGVTWMTLQWTFQCESLR